jgi:hypothetical protein
MRRLAIENAHILHQRDASQGGRRAGEANSQQKCLQGNQFHHCLALFGCQQYPETTGAATGAGAINLR